MNRYLLDTNACIAMMLENAGVLARLREVGMETLWLCALCGVTLGRRSAPWVHSQFSGHGRRDETGFQPWSVLGRRPGALPQAGIKARLWRFPHCRVTAR